MESLRDQIDKLNKAREESGNPWRIDRNTNAGDRFETNTETGVTRFFSTYNEWVMMNREHPFATQSEIENITAESYKYLNDPDEFTPSQIDPRFLPGNTYGTYGKIKRCPIWALVHKLEGKSVGAGDRCGPKCQLYEGELGDCAFKVIAKFLRLLVNKVDTNSKRGEPDEDME